MQLGLPCRLESSTLATHRCSTFIAIYRNEGIRLRFFGRLASWATATQSADAAADPEACQSGGLIQKRLDSQKAVLTHEANLGLNSSAKKQKVSKKKRRAQRLQVLLGVILLPAAAPCLPHNCVMRHVQAEHADLMAFLAKSREATGRPEGSDCQQGALACFREFPWRFFRVEELL